LVSAVDLGTRGYSTARIHGPDDARFLDGIRDYDIDLYRIDPMLQFALRVPDAGYVTLQMAIAHTGVNHVDHPYVRWSADVLGTGNSMVRYTRPDDDLILGVSLHPSAVRSSHSENDVRLFAMLFEHIERAMRLAARPPDFSSTEDARLLVDARGRIRVASEAARTLLAAADGLSILDGRLVAARRQDGMRIDKLIQSALGAIIDGGAGGGIVVPRPSGKRGWILTVSPLLNPPSPFEAFRPSVLIRIVEPEATSTRPREHRIWATTFGLTPTEIRLTDALLSGDIDLRQAADRLGIAYGTARVHLSHVFDKVGVNSQAQLACLLTRISG
jgi:DNA-binding CsgD family transcriptional regulator